MSKLDMDDFSKSFESFLKGYLEKRFDQFIQGAGFNAVRRGVHIVSARDVSMGYANIFTLAEKIDGHVFQIFRGEANETVTGDARAYIVVPMLRVQSGVHMYKLTELDKIHWIIF